MKFQINFEKIFQLKKLGSTSIHERNYLESFLIQEHLKAMILFGISTFQPTVDVKVFHKKASVFFKFIYTNFWGSCFKSNDFHFNPIFLMYHYLDL